MKVAQMEEPASSSEEVLLHTEELRKGPWTAEEDEMLRRFVAQVGRSVAS